MRLHALNSPDTMQASSTCILVQCKNDFHGHFFCLGHKDFRLSGHPAHQISTPLCKVSPGEGSRLDKSTYPRVGQVNLSIGRVVTNQWMLGSLLSSRAFCETATASGHVTLQWSRLGTGLSLPTSKFHRMSRHAEGTFLSGSQSLWII